MFPQVFADFDARVREVDLYFQFLAALDNEEIVVRKGAGPQVVPIGPAPVAWHRMLKGAAYLILYNLVEAFIRRGFQAVYESIQADRLSGIELTELLRSQWVTQKTRKVRAFDGSPKVYTSIAIEIVDEIVAKGIARLHRDQLPVSGNLDADNIRELCNRHGVDHTTPASAKGGSALKIVKRKRNSLSHGDESFSECGRQVSAADLIQAKDEAVAFIRGILTNLQTFAASKSYKGTP